MISPKKISVSIRGRGIVVPRGRWFCRLCKRTFKLPPDFPGDEQFESVCCDCVIVKLVEGFPYRPLKRS